MTSFNSSVRSADRRLADELGIPDDAPIRRLVIEGGGFPPKSRAAWAGFRLDLFGVTIYDENEIPDPCPWPYVRRGGILQLWQELVHFGDSPVYGRVHWNPTNGEHVSIHGLEVRYTDDDISRARSGIELLRAFNNRGRRPRSGRKITVSDLHSGITRWLNEHNGEPPTQDNDDFSRLFSIGPRTLQRKIQMLSRQGFDWPTTVRELMAIYDDVNGERSP